MRTNEQRKNETAVGDRYRGQELHRRRFLTSAAASLAVPCFVPGRVLGRDGATAPSERVTLGIIGTGGRGTANMKSFLPLTDAQVLAVCDVRRGQRDRAASIVGQHYGQTNPCDACNDFREVLDRADIDAVVISPQDHWHAAIAVPAARAGKDMYCEKPLGVSLRDGAAIRDAVRRYERVFQTGTQQRSDVRFRQACNLARFGYLGKVTKIEVGAPGPQYEPRATTPPTPEPIPDGFDYEMYLGPAPWRPYTRYCIDWPGWYLIWDLCAGFVVNWGVHHLDIAHWGCPSIGQQPCRVVCRSTYRTHPVCDNIYSWQAEFAFDDGMLMSFSDSGNPIPSGCKFIGEEGWVHVNRGSIRAEPASLLDVRIASDQPSLYESKDHYADFVQAVRERRDPVAPVEAGRIASMFGHLAEAAGRLQRELRWDPVAENFGAAEDANRLLARAMRSPWQI